VKGIKGLFRFIALGLTLLLLAVGPGMAAFSAGLEADLDAAAEPAGASAFDPLQFKPGVLPSDPSMLAGHVSTDAPSPEEIAALPAAFDNTENYPPIGNQGGQGSCVAWAVAYAYKTMQEKADHNWDISVAEHQFSPAFMYNQIVVGNDGGAYIHDAFNQLVDIGAVPLSMFPYTDKDYRTKPTEEQFAEAKKHVAADWDYVYGLDAAKQGIYETGGVVIGIAVYHDFDYLSESNPIYDKFDYGYRGLHAIALIGWDDSKQAFKFQNSWGSGYGLSGYGWLSYNLFKTGVGYSYTMHDIDEDDDGEDTQAPKVEIANLEALKEGVAQLTFSVTDNVEVGDVYAGVWSERGVADFEWVKVEPYSQGKYEFTIDAADYDGYTGYYHPAILAFDTSGNVTNKEGPVFVMSGLTDTAAPEVHKAYITDVTDEGFALEFTVTDDVGLKYVFGGAWALAGDGTDFQWKQLQPAEDVANLYRFEVNIKEHGGLTGGYQTAILAYDTSYNSYNAAGPVATVGDADTEPPTVQKPIIMDLSPNGFVLDFYCTDDTKLGGVYCGAWVEGGDPEYFQWEKVEPMDDDTARYQYKVDITNYGNKGGVFHTAIYAYDTTGNYVNMEGPIATIE